MQANTEKSTQLAELKADKMQMQSTIDSLSGLDAQIQAAASTAKEMDEIVPTPMESFDIHYLINGVCQKAGVQLQGLSIGEYKAIEQNANSSDNDTSSVSGLPANCTKSMVSLKAAGSANAILAVADQLSQIPYALVTTVSIESMNDPSTLAVIGVELYAIS